MFALLSSKLASGGGVLGAGRIASAVRAEAQVAVRPSTQAAWYSVLQRASGGVVSPSATTTPLVVSPVAPHAPSPPQRAAPWFSLTQVRRMGLFDSMQDGLQKQKEKRMDSKRQELFKAQLDYLGRQEKYGIDQHILQLKESADAVGLTGWKSKFRSSETQRELKNQFAEIDIGDALSEHEREDVKNIDRRAKLRIATQLGIDVSRVNKFINGFEEMKALHFWVQTRRAKNLPLPSTPEEYREMLMADPSGTSRSRAKKNLGRVRSMRAMYGRR